MIDKNSMLVRRVHRPFEDRQNVVEWRMTDRNREGAEWDERKWKREIDRAVKADGLSEWKNRMDRKGTLRWYREKEAPKHEVWYDGSLGGDLLFRVRAQYVEVNDRTYRWSEDRRKV